MKKMKCTNHRRALYAAAVAGLTCSYNSAHAAAATGMPWEGPLKKIADSLTGPTALIISIIAIAVTAMVLIFGGEMPEIARKLVILVLVISVLVGGASFLTTVVGVNAAVF